MHRAAARIAALSHPAETRSSFTVSRWFVYAVRAGLCMQFRLRSRPYIERSPGPGSLERPLGRPRLVQSIRSPINALMARASAVGLHRGPVAGGGGNRSPEQRVRIDHRALTLRGMKGQLCPAAVDSANAERSSLPAIDHGMSPAQARLIPTARPSAPPAAWPAALAVRAAARR